MIAIIDCCGSNFASIQYAFERLGQSCLLTHDKDAISRADYVILPGVGHARSSMEALKSHALDTFIPTLKQPVLGICLGMQLLYSHSEEGDTKCLDIIQGKVRFFGAHNSKESVPHMGWNTLTNIAEVNLLQDIDQTKHLYFVHSYYADITEDCMAECNYILPFAAMVQKRNFYGMQFHPEKSGTVGETLLRNFINEGKK